MRLFTAIDLPPDILMRLERLISALRPEALVHWSPIDNLHVTTKFIGEWPESRLDELHRVLAPLARREPFDMDVNALGWFPNERAPRVLWAGIHAGDGLRDLARQTEERLLQLGIRKEEREFSPHLTLARIKGPVPLRRLREKVQEMQPAELGQFAVSQFALYRSEPGSNASLYRKLREYRFGSAAAAAS